MWSHKGNVSQIEIYKGGACGENMNNKHVEPGETFELFDNCIVDKAPVHNHNYEVQNRGKFEGSVRHSEKHLFRLYLWVKTADDNQNWAYNWNFERPICEVNG